MSSVLGSTFLGDSPDYGKLASQSEAKRQGINKMGLQQINSVFGGGTAPFYSLASGGPFNQADWNATGRKNVYYTLNNQGQFGQYYGPKDQTNATSSLINRVPALSPGAANLFGIGQIASGDTKGGLKNVAMNTIAPGSSSILGLFGGGPPSSRELVNSQLKKGLLFNAPTNQTFEGFQEPFFQQRAQDYVNYALPQFADQYQATRNAELYGLANKGLTGSSVAAKAASDLERTAGQAKQTIADTGQNQANDLRTQIEGARQNAINQLYQTADPAQAAQSAISTSAQFQRPSVFAPLTNMFSNLAQQYYTNQILSQTRNPYGLAGYGQNQGPNLAASLGPNTY